MVFDIWYWWLGFEGCDVGLGVWLLGRVRDWGVGIFGFGVLGMWNLLGEGYSFES